MKTPIRQPDWRWQRIQESVQAKKPPTDAFELRIYNVLIGEVNDETVQYVLDMHRVPYQRDTLMAFFLSNATLDQIQTGLGVDLSSAELFETLFIDRSVFRNKMEWRMFAKYYAATFCEDDATRKQLESGVAKGPHLLMSYWCHGNEQVDIPDQLIAHQLQMVAYEKALVAKGAAITSAEAREAKQWGAAAMRNILDRANMKTQNDLETDAIIAIQKRKATLTAAEANLDLGEILH